MSRSYQKFTVGLVLSGGVLLGQLLYAQSAERNSYANIVPLMRLTTLLDSEISQARISLEKAMLGDTGISVQSQVNEVLANCESLASVATTGGSTALGRVVATQNSDQLRRFGELKQEIGKLNGLATARWSSKARYQAGGPAETEFEQQYSVIRKLLRESHDFLDNEIADGKSKATWAMNLALFSAAGILGVVGFWDYRSRALTSELSRELERQQQDLKLASWTTTGEAALSEAIRGDLEYGEISRLLISVLTQHLGCQVGVFYRRNQQQFELSASYAFTQRRSLETSFKEGEGLLGQAALERQPIILTQIPPDFLQIESGIGVAQPANLVVFPLVRGKSVVAVLEFASLQSIEPHKVEFLKKINDSITLALEASEHRSQTLALIQHGQAQAEQLKLRLAELRAADDHVQELGQNLQETDDSLRAKSAELEAHQAELSRALELLEESKQDLDSKSSQFIQTQNYQADFLAHLGKEVRSPLKKIVLLSKSLWENPLSNLTGKQLESSEAIRQSAEELEELFEHVLGKSSSVDEETAEMPAVQASMADILAPEPVVSLPPAQSSAGTAPSLLIVEDDVVFAKVLSRIAEAEGYRPVVLHNGASCLATAKSIKPAAIILDVELPDSTGWGLLRLLRGDSETQGIPVHFISSQQPCQDLGEAGAQGYSVKPVSRSVLHDTLRHLFPSSGESGPAASAEVRTILLIESDARLTESLRSYLEKPYLRVEVAATSQAAKEKLTGLHIDCIVLDLNLGENSAETGLQMLDWLQHPSQSKDIPVLVHTGTDITTKLETEILEAADRLIIPGSSSYERLKDEVELFLYQVKKPTLKAPSVPERPSGLAGKTVLVVEDNVDELKALVQVLEEQDIRVICANDGLQALEKLADSKNIDLVLMDVLLPRMDGIEATRRIRANKDFKYIPVIALTDQAMAGDRLRFLKAGASDYLTKPIDISWLFSVIRIWTTQAQSRKSAKQAHLAP